jgi:hypothetical protein
MNVRVTPSSGEGTKGDGVLPNLGMYVCKEGLSIMQQHLKNIKKIFDSRLIILTHYPGANFLLAVK